MSCHNKEALEQMLEDVVNELDLSESAIAEHGPNGTPPAELVRLVLQQKDRTIRNLRAGMTDCSQLTALRQERERLRGAIQSAAAQLNQVSGQVSRGFLGRVKSELSAALDGAGKERGDD